MTVRYLLHYSPHTLWKLAQTPPKQAKHEASAVQRNPDPECWVVAVERATSPLVSWHQTSNGSGRPVNTQSSYALLHPWMPLHQTSHGLFFNKTPSHRGTKPGQDHGATRLLWHGMLDFCLHWVTFGTCPPPPETQMFVYFRGQHLNFRGQDSKDNLDNIPWAGRGPTFVFLEGSHAGTILLAAVKTQKTFNIFNISPVLSIFCEYAL